MSGFKTEAQLWDYLYGRKKRLRGKWKRVEVVFPDGVLDSMGTCNGVLHFMELKIEGTPLRESQIEFIDWMEKASISTWVAVGSPHKKKVWYYRGRGVLSVIPPFVKD